MQALFRGGPPIKAAEDLGNNIFIVQLDGNLRPVIAVRNQVLIIGPGQTVRFPQQRLLRGQHILPEKREFLEAAESGGIGRLLPLTELLVLLRDAGIHFDFNNREFI